MVSLTVRTAFAFAIAALFAMPAAATDRGAFVAHLSGAEEVPPADTRARGQATFMPNADGSGLAFRLIVANIEAVTQSHIHLAPAGSNGGVVAFLFGFASEGVTVNGTLAQGILTDSDLIGALAGMTIDDLLDEIEAGNAYVNVHTQFHPPRRDSRPNKIVARIKCRRAPYSTTYR